MIPALPLAREHPQNASELLSLGSVFDQSERFLAREFEQFPVTEWIRNMKTELSGLTRAKKFSWPSELQIGLGNLKPVRSTHHGVEPRTRFLGHSKRRHQNAIRLLRAAPNAPAKLVQLRETESFRMLDHHHGGVRDVHADFHDGRRDQDLHLVLVEALHDFVFFLA